MYSLTRWYFDDVFKEKCYIFNGEMYVEGGNLKDGSAAAYKDMEEVTLFKNTYPKENFIPLKKY